MSCLCWWASSVEASTVSGYMVEVRSVDVGFGSDEDICSLGFLAWHRVERFVKFVVSRRTRIAQTKARSKAETKLDKNEQGAR